MKRKILKGNTHSITIRVSDELHNAIIDVADMEEKTISTVLREKLKEILLKK